MGGLLRKPELKEWVWIESSYSVIFCCNFLDIKKIFFSQVGFFILKSDSMSAAREHKQFQLSKSIPDNRFFMEVRIMAKIFNAHHVFILKYQLICTYSFLANYQNSFFVVVVAIWKKKRQLGLFSFGIVTTTKITG